MMRMVRDSGEHRGEVENVIDCQKNCCKHVKCEVNRLFSFRANTTGNCYRALKEVHRSMDVNPFPYSDHLEEKRHEERKSL